MNDATTTDRLREPLDRDSGKPPGDLQRARPQSSDWLLGSGALCILAACLAFGAWQSYQQYRQALQTVEQRRDFIPNVRVSTVRTSDGLIRTTLPATTLAFAQANINARATGYIEKRYADIGDRVKAGQLLAKITAASDRPGSGHARSKQGDSSASAGQSRSCAGNLGARQAAGRERLGHPSTGFYRYPELKGT